MPSLASVAGNYTFQLFGNDQPTNLDGHGRRDRLDHRHDRDLLHRASSSRRARSRSCSAMEFVTLVVFAVVALIKVYANHPAALGRARVVVVQPVRHLEHQRAERRDPAGGVHLLGLGLRRQRQRGDRGLEHGAGPGGDRLDVRPGRDLPARDDRGAGLRRTRRRWSTTRPTCSRRSARACSARGSTSC